MIKLDLVPSSIKPVLHASQYDDGRQWECQILNDGTPYVFKEGDTVEFQLRKGDGLVVTCSVAVVPGASTVTLVSTEQMCAVYGSNLGEFKIKSEGVDIGSVNVILEVEKDPTGGDPNKKSASEIWDLQAQVDACVTKELETVGAKLTGYDNSESGLEATNVQDAIDEVNTKIDNIPSVDAYTKEEANDKFATKNALQTVANAVEGKFNDFSEILPVGKEWQVQESVNSIQDKRAAYNAQYQRITFANNQTYYACKVYPVTAGKYRIKGYGSDTNTTSVLAVVGNADIITSGASYCNLLQVIQAGSTTYGWHTVTVDIEQDGYLYVNYSYFAGDKTSTVEKEVAIGQTVVITDDSLTSEYLPANAKAVGEAIRNATQKNGIIKNGTTYQHFSYSHGNKFIFRTIAPVGANGLYDYKSVAVGHFENGSAVIDTTFFTAFTDQIGPVSMRLSGDSGSNLWTGGVHTKTIDGTDYPTAELQSINVYVDGVDISNSADGIYYGDCRIVTNNNLYAPATITGADLSTATLAIVETRTFILTDTLKVQVKLEFKESSIVGLYYGMQNQDNHTNTILLPTAGLELARADMTSGAVSNSKEWAIMLSDSNNYHFDMLLDYFGLGNWDKNDGTSSYGRISHYSTTKIYFVLCSGGTFNQGDIMFWQGEYRTYHD